MGCILRLVSGRIGSSMQYSLNGKLQLGNYHDAQACRNISRFRREYYAKSISFSLRSYLSLARFILKLLRLLWVTQMEDMQNIKFLNLIVDEEHIRTEHFKWSQANKTFIIKMQLALS